MRASLRAGVLRAEASAHEEQAMKRLHVPPPVPDLPASLPFPAGRVDTAPSVANRDHAEEVLDEPRPNFVLSPRDGQA